MQTQTQVGLCVQTGVTCFEKLLASISIQFGVKRKSRLKSDLICGAERFLICNMSEWNNIWTVTTLCCTKMTIFSKKFGVAWPVCPPLPTPMCEALLRCQSPRFIVKWIALLNSLLSCRVNSCGVWLKFEWMSKPNLSNRCRQTTKALFLFPTTYRCEAVFQQYNYF